MRGGFCGQLTGLPSQFSDNKCYILLCKNILSVITKTKRLIKLLQIQKIGYRLKLYLFDILYFEISYNYSDQTPLREKCLKCTIFQMKKISFNVPQFVLAPKEVFSTYIGFNNQSKAGSAFTLNSHPPLYKEKNLKLFWTLFFLLAIQRGETLLKCTI